MPYRLEFELLGLPKSPNQLMKKRVVDLKKAERKRWLRDVSLITSGKRPDAPLTRARLTAIRCSSVTPDYEGIVGSFKFVIDALVELGILKDDNMNVIGMPDFRHEKAPPNMGKIKIVVEALE